MRELRPGLWWWEATHPEWEPEEAATEDWGPEVSSYAIDDGERLLLLDPTDPPAPVAALAARREVVIVLTCPWHARAAPSLVKRFGAVVYSPAPETEREDLAVRVFAAGTGYRSGSRRSREWSQSISCSGSKAPGRLSPATR